MDNNLVPAKERKYTQLSPGTPWHHGPPHFLSESGCYMVTAGTYDKLQVFHDKPRLDLLHGALMEIANEFKWQLHAWAVFSNHYHFIATSPKRADSLTKFIGKYHMTSAKALNKMNGTPGKKVWHQYWDSLIDFENSYWPRLHYVFENPVKHGLVRESRDYPWCSANWMEKNADASVLRKMKKFKTDKLQIEDDF